MKGLAGSLKPQLVQAPADQVFFSEHYKPYSESQYCSRLESQWETGSS